MAAFGDHVLVNSSRTLTLVLASALNLCLQGVLAQAAPLHVEYGDCASVLSGTRCALGEKRQLRLWVRADPGAPIRIGDGETRFSVLERFDVAGGTHFRIEIPWRSRRVEVRANDNDVPATWSLELVEDSEAPELAEVRTLFNARDFDAAEALIQTLIADNDFAQPGGAQRLAGIFYHNRGDPEKARYHYQQAIDKNLADGRGLGALRAASALSYLLQQTFHDFTAARLVYERFDEDASTPAEARFFRAYDLGLIGFNSGDPRAAFTHLTAAASQAIRMGSAGRWQQRRLDAEEMLAAQLQRLGRRDDAQAYFDAWAAQDLGSLGACQGAYFLGNVGWNALLRLEAGEQASDPTALLEQAQTVLREQCPTSDAVSGEINLALAHFHAGRFEASAQALARARATTDSPELRMRFWEMDIAARLALQNGRPDSALATIQAMEALASATLSPDARWRASARKGVVLEHMGLNDDALAAYAAADARFIEDLESVPFYAGRGHFAATREWATRRRLALLLAKGAQTQAADLVRESARRAYQALSVSRSARSGDALAQRERAFAEYTRIRHTLSEEFSAGWRVPKDELAVLEARRAAREQAVRGFLDRTIHSLDEADTHAIGFDAPTDGELLLAFHPLPRGWLAIAITGTQTVTATPACATNALTPDDLALCLIEPFDALIDSARRLVLLPTGRLRAVDIHALKIGDDILLERLPVVYSMDAGGRRSTALSGSRAVVVGDPTRQLKNSQQEAREVASLLSQGGRFAVQMLAGQDANYTAVRAGLAGIDLFHFAGHAVFEHASSWNSALALAGGGSLSVSDVFSFAQTPTLAVLSACDTARTAGNPEGGTSGDAMGLAQAFVLRGSQAVIATSQPVQDRDALALMRTFYGLWRDGLETGEALQRAQLALRKTNPNGGWSAYRLVVR